jgi:hypothetical protein
LQAAIERDGNAGQPGTWSLIPIQQEPNAAVAELLSWAVSSFKKNVNGC